jgi:type I site-specific restriction endonuclease
VDAELLRRGSTRVRRDEIQAKWVANQIAFKRAIEKTGASKVITFHSRVNLAEDFAGDDARGFKEHVKGFDVFHVNGSQNAADRKALLEGFKAAPKGLITNARCLTEGVDVPAVDMVAFVDPRKSKIDIAQAAGRAMRQSKATNKKLGYIVVPLFIEQKKGETEAEAFTRAGFDEVAEVLGAMLESDDDLVDTIEKMQEARGRGDKFNPRQLHEKIEVIGPAIDLGELTRSIDVEILDRLGTSWHRWYGLLKKFREETGHCRTAVDQVIDGFKIGIWVNNQRQNKDKLSQEQIRLLELLEFSWDPLAEQWEENYQALREFINSSGNRYVVQGTVFKGHNLGSWVNAQRLKKRRGQLTLEQINKLDSIHFSWEPISDQWNETFNALKSFKNKTGHCRITKSQSSEYANLGIWAHVQRTLKSKLSTEQIIKLDSIGFSWDPISEKWEEAFEALKTFRKKVGHCRVARGQVIAGVKLGDWVSLQRRRLKNALMPKYQVDLLNSVGFSWNPASDNWEEAFTELVKFHKINGHCNVPQLKTQNNCNLGNWVSNQRKNKSRLSPEQVRRLESLNFCWDTLSQQWEASFDELVKFHKREGHCRVVAKFVVNKIGLGMWVSRQRKKRDQLSKDQLTRLDSLGFCWDPLAEQWEAYFDELVKFH